jgi:hypothetical protein
MLDMTQARRGCVLVANRSGTAAGLLGACCRLLRGTLGSQDVLDIHPFLQFRGQAARSFESQLRCAPSISAMSSYMNHLNSPCSSVQATRLSERRSSHVATVQIDIVSIVTRLVQRQDFWRAGRHGVAN